MSKAGQYHEKILAANGGTWFDFEGLVRDIYVSILQKGDVALDVGVNRGDHLLQMAAAVGPGGHVIGVEAAPAMVELTGTFLKSSGLDKFNNVTLHNVAVGDHEGTAKLNFVKSQPGLSSLADREVARTYDVEILDCRVTTVDRLLQGFARRVNFAKFDIEGAEYHALKGASRLFGHDRPPMVFEYDKTSPVYFGYHADQLLGMFRANGYIVQDFFGYSYEQAQDLYDSGVWNFFAAPAEEIEKYRIPALVAQSLAGQGRSFPDRVT